MRKLMVVLFVLCCGLMSQNALAAANLGLKGAGVEVGMVSPEDSDAALGMGVFADWGSVAPKVRLASHLGFWSQSEEEFGTKLSFRDITLSTRAKYMFPVSSPKFQPYMGAGLGIHFLNMELEMPGYPTTEDSETKLGLELGGGFSTPLNPNTEFRTDLWYGIVEDFSQLSLKVAMAFKIGS